MKVYSQDLREKVLRAVDQDKSRREIINMFGVSLATLKRYLKQRRETGNVLPKPIPGQPSKKYAPLRSGLVTQLQDHPNVILEEHCHLWKESHGMPVSTTTMSRAIRRIGWKRKEVFHATAASIRRSSPHSRSQEWERRWSLRARPMARRSLPQMRELKITDS